MLMFLCQSPDSSQSARSVLPTDNGRPPQEHQRRLQGRTTNVSPQVAYHDMEGYKVGVLSELKSGYPHISFDTEKPQAYNEVVNILFACAFCKTEVDTFHFLLCGETRQKGKLNISKRKLNYPVIALHIGEFETSKTPLTIAQYQEILRDEEEKKYAQKFANKRK